MEIISANAALVPLRLLKIGDTFTFRGCHIVYMRCERVAGDLVSSIPCVRLSHENAGKMTSVLPEEGVKQCVMFLSEKP